MRYIKWDAKARVSDAPWAFRYAKADFLHDSFPHRWLRNDMNLEQRILQLQSLGVILTRVGRGST